MIIAGMCLLPALVAGAISDIRNRTFPASYFEWPAKIGGIITVIAYLCMIADGDWMVAVYIAGSLILALAFYAMGLRFGSGGDWRALIYVCVICPLLIIPTLIVSIFVGAGMAIYAMRNEDELVPTPFRSVPFSVAILAGLVVAIAYGMAFWV